MSLTSKSLSYLAVIVFTFILQSCTNSIGYTKKATLDHKAAQNALHDLTDQPLIFILPTESRKEKLLAQIGKTKQLNALIEKRDIINSGIIDAFTDSITFTQIYFVPDSIFRACSAGSESNCFVDSENQLQAVQGVDLSDPYKMIVYDYSHLEILRGNELIPNPFPNRFRIGSYSNNKSFIVKLFPFLRNTNWSKENLRSQAGRINTIFETLEY